MEFLSLCTRRSALSLAFRVVQAGAKHTSLDLFFSAVSQLTEKARMRAWPLSRRVAISRATLGSPFHTLCYPLKRRCQWVDLFSLDTFVFFVYCSLRLLGEDAYAFLQPSFR